MEPITVTMAPGAERTRVRVTIAERDVLTAQLPPGSQAHPKAAATLLEGLALWHQQRLFVVVCVDERDSSGAALELYDVLEGGGDRLHFDVAVVPSMALANRRDGDERAEAESGADQ